MQQVNSETTPGRKSTGTAHSFAHRALYEDAPVAAVHVQGTVKRIERETPLYSKLFQLHKRHSLVALRTVEKNSCL
eukprot:2041567-Amphidinium_carterae.1